MLLYCLNFARRKNSFTIIIHILFTFDYSHHPYIVRRPYWFLRNIIFPQYLHTYKDPGGPIRCCKHNFTIIGFHLSHDSARVPQYCSKICLVTVYPTGHREKAVKLYVILDDQSNRSLASSAFFDTFKIKEASSSYLLKTCTGVSEETGRRAIGYQIESFDGQTTLPLPTLIECNQFPTDREEIPTPEVALHHRHLKGIAHLIPELDP